MGVMVITFVVGFATGPGSIPWFFVTELFTQGARGMATSVAVVTNWTANFLVGLGSLLSCWRLDRTFSLFSSFCKSSLLAFGSKSRKPRTKPSKKLLHNSDKIFNTKLEKKIPRFSQSKTFPPLPHVGKKPF